jgi:peptidoglycan hydrolase CwlO-like protein
MAENTKTGLIISIIFCVIFAGTTAAFFILHRQEQEMRVKLEDELSALTSKKAQLENELREVANEKRQVEGQLSGFRERAEELTVKIESERNRREEIERKLITKEGEFNLLERDLQEAKKNIDNLQQRHQDLQSENKELSDRLHQLRLAKNALEVKIGGSSEIEGVQLGRVVVRPDREEPETARQKPQGKILVVNREFDFVMISLGRMSGVKTGDKFGVYHDDKLVAELEVERVYEDMCSAVILREERKSRIYEDDWVKML